MQKLPVVLERLRKGDPVGVTELAAFVRGLGAAQREELCAAAGRLKTKLYGNRVFLRGLIECSNYCKNDCYYCGIRCDNRAVSRYRLTADEILQCCAQGYEGGMRTFVLQSGEDPWYTDEKTVDLIRAIKAAYPDCALTLSIGERPGASYEAFFKAGADRYLLRHETADEAHYRKLHPQPLSLQNRLACLYVLKETGFAVGAGFMVGSPGQSEETLARDLLFLRQLEPQMVGIGPFLPHHQTPFAHCPPGSLEDTLLMVALARLILPKALVPATTALETLSENGRLRALACGANVVMINLSPVSVRKSYLLYDNKAAITQNGEQSIARVKGQLEAAGFDLSPDRGDPAE